MDLHISDILLINHNFEPSRVKLWEIVRRYNPIQMAAYLYILENVRVSAKKVPVACDERLLFEFSRYSEHEESRSLEFQSRPNLRVTRVEPDPVRLFAQRPRTPSVARHPSDINVMELLDRLRRPEFFENLDTYLQILIHNLGTPMYRRFYATISYLLFSDNLQSDRTEIKTRESIVVNYLRFYKMLTFQENVIDPRNLRFIILPPSRRIYERPKNLYDAYIVQPLYQGLHVVINANQGKVKCYNRYAEHHTGLLNKLTFDDSFTCEAVVLPVNRAGRLRSWRFWRFRSDFILFVVDIFRYRNTVLVNSPFSERLKYVSLIKHPYVRHAESRSWDEHEERYYERADMYDPCVGIVLRRKSALPSERSLEYRFNLATVYDLRAREFLRLSDMEPERLNERQCEDLHYSYEMADHRVTCIAYAHTDTEFYLCLYNERVHQFEHVGTLMRDPCDAPPVYRREHIVVLNGRVKAQGVLYLRVYYDKHRRIIGYEQKPMHGKYAVPLRNRLFCNRVDEEGEDEDNVGYDKQQ